MNCKYRNCKNEIGESKRKDSIYCSIRCKDNEKKYKQRRIKQLKVIKTKLEEKIKLSKIVKIIEEGQK